MRRLTTALPTALAAAAVVPPATFAADGGAINAGDTAWLLVATALVMVMLPGLALFYGGLVRRKNVLSTIMHSFFGLALVCVVWVIVGFSIAFAPDATGTGLFGGLDFFMFNGVGPPLAATGLAANALVATNTAAGAATITWVLASYIHKRKVSVLGAACGAVAGLVAITPASGFVTAGGALVIGLAVGGLCYSAAPLRPR